MTELLEPSPDQYLPEPDYAEAQDDEDFLDGLDLEERFDGLVKGFASALSARSSTPATRTWQQNVDWAHDQIDHPSQWWEGLCQKFCRTAVGAGGGFASAWDQWLGMPVAAKHAGGNVNDAPVGSLLFSKGDSRFGHVWIAARSFSSGTPGSISTDIQRTGFPDRCSRQGLLDAWGHDFLGWGTNMNGTSVDVKDPHPVDSLHYQALGAARDQYRKTLDHLRTARETAIDQKDWKDRDAIQKEIDLCKKSVARADRLFDTLRRS